MSGVNELACVFVVAPSIDYSIEQVFSPAGPSWRSRYMESHIRSKIPNIIKLGQIVAWVFEMVEQFHLQGEEPLVLPLEGA